MLEDLLPWINNLRPILPVTAVDIALLLCQHILRPLLLSSMPHHIRASTDTPLEATPKDLASGSNRPKSAIWCVLGDPTTPLVAKIRTFAGQAFLAIQHYSAQGGDSHIDYKLFVTVRRSRFAVNSTVSTNFVYLPHSIAEPPSALREVAYREGSAIIGPDDDPEGWQVLSTADIKGRMFATKSVSVQCILAIASPLSFAINTPIPLFLTLSGNDEVAVALLSEPSAVVVRLVRTLVVGDSTISRSGSLLDETVGRAVFWPASGSGPTPNVKKLAGELHVRRRSTLSFSFEDLAVRYNVSLYPSQAPGFAAEASPHQALVSHEIRVTLRNSPGVTPRSFVPLGTVSEASEQPEYNPARFLFAGGMDTFTWSC
ncbi:hypothetical protein BV25DRAFT_1911946 [Artomyces pyxidatus]|uniref:Uncharacterized protein n=1 Tax=Artomyces pyxidatus TaxID=48021 RepID=A0ACB8TFT1_9AGAM|nr:hypothetical protein BV25DRAFT_1911946 [Artomyces pyxidatus]